MWITALFPQAGGQLPGASLLASPASEASPCVSTSYRSPGNAPLPTTDRQLSLCLGLPGWKEAIRRLSPLSLCESALSVGQGWPAASLVAEGRGGR